jgi:hypothetical protein
MAADRLDAGKHASPRLKVLPVYTGSGGLVTAVHAAFTISWRRASMV